MDKIILINKPLGWTSNDVVVKIKHACGYKKVGHAGTLDPQASGLLILAYDEGTKLLSKLILENKEYEAKIVFGSKTKTGDASSEIVETKPCNLTLKEINNFIDYFINNPYMQKPHRYSAVKIHGQKAYQLARENKEVEIPPKLVKINFIKIIKFDESNQTLDLILNVSKGFYVRSFAEDLAQKLNTLGHVSKLHRTKCGDFDIKNAYTLIDYLNINKK